MPFDYIICGAASEVSRWAECARASDCISEVNVDRNYVRAGRLAVDVIPFNNLRDFIEIEAQAAIILTRKPAREKSGDDNLARQIVGEIFSEMNSGDVKCFEQSNNGEWIEFQIDQQK